MNKRSNYSAQKGVWLSIQPSFVEPEEIPYPEGSPNRAKLLQVMEGTARVFGLARKCNVKLAWGTDILFDEKLAEQHGKQLVAMGRWFKPHEVLRMVTHDNAALLKPCGPRDPYPDGLGVIEEGALADMLLVDGNPLKELSLL